MIPYHIQLHLIKTQLINKANRIKFENIINPMIWKTFYEKAGKSLYFCIEKKFFNYKHIVYRKK